MKLLENPALLLLLAAALIALGPKVLPDLGRVIGETLRAVREGLNGAEGDDTRIGDESRQ